MNKLTLVTVTNRIKGWEDYCKTLSKLRTIYGDRFSVLILDNSEKTQYNVKRNLLNHYVDYKLEDLERKDIIRMVSMEGFLNCRKAMGVLTKTEYMSVLDDDDIIVDSFLPTFEFLITQDPEVDLFNLLKYKLGQGEYPMGSTEYIPKEDRLKHFYRFSHYAEDKNSKYYPINGYCILKTELYRRVADTFEFQADDCYAMMKCYIEAEHVYKVPLVWQFYTVQNQHLNRLDKLEEIEKSLYNQMKRLYEEYETNLEVIKLLNLQTDNLIKSITVNSDNIKYFPRKLNNLKQTYE